MRNYPLGSPGGQRFWGSRAVGEKDSDSRNGTEHIGEAVRQSGKLLRYLLTQLVRLYRDRDFPLVLKVLLAPLLFMLPIWSIMILIFVGELFIHHSRDESIDVLPYLIFLGTTACLALIISMGYALAAARFENTRYLEIQMQSVTNSRRQRRAATLPAA